MNLPMQPDPRLAGPPLRTSRQFNEQGAIRLTGLLKLRLGHSANGSVLVPEQLFIEDDTWLFYQTSFFGPPILLFDMEPGLHLATFNLDVGYPRTNEPTRIIVTIRSDELVRRYDDGAALYRCIIEGTASLTNYATGQAQLLPNKDFSLKLFHITSESAAESITKSGEIWSSCWNLQGTRELTNVAYVYLTSLPNVCDENDLRRIAMASDGVICFQTTSSRPNEEVLALKVYRESTKCRTHSLPVAVPSELLAPPHLLLHRQVDAYYEVVGPEIFRIGLRPGTSLSYVSEKGSASLDSLKRFSYIVVGDAAEIEGLVAPYDEEETKQIMHLERLEQHDFFQFWQDNANSDQMTGRSFELRKLR